MMSTLILAFIGATLAGSLRPAGVWVGLKDLPFERTHAIVQAAGIYVVGGLNGLHKGFPGKWELIDNRPVRDLASQEGVVWALYGDGSLDKLDLGEDRLFYDVLQDGAKRPWVSSIALSGKDGVLLGSMGGWMEKSPAGLGQQFPKELAKMGVTAIARNEDSVWLGTQKSGLFRYESGKLTRFGFAAGLPDTWVTSIAASGKTTFVGVADGGIVAIRSGKVSPVECPTKRIVRLLVFGGRLVAGGLDGAWLQTGKAWQRLCDREITTLAKVGNKLAIGTPQNLLWWN